MVIDVSVAGTHAASDLRYTINADKYSSDLVYHGADHKDQKHAHYIHDGNAMMHCHRLDPWRDLQSSHGLH